MALLLASLAIAAVLVFQACELWLASYRLDSAKLEPMELGAALVPGDGSAWDRLGRLRQWDLIHPDLQGAIADFQRAVQVDPRSAYFWMDLGSAYEAAGDAGRARDAFAQAQSEYPASADVAFHYGNFLLRQQDFPEAYKELRQAVRADPTLLPLTISRAWRSSEDADQLLDNVLPQDTASYLQALDFLASIHRGEPALAVWQRLLALGKTLPIARTFPFFDELIREDRADEASRAWRRALAAAGLPHDEPANDSAIWNGNFAKDFTNGGLDWRWTPTTGVAISFDTEPPPGGSRAIRLDFSGGNNVSLEAPSEYVAVEPNRRYHFHAYERTDAVTTESGISFSITDPNHAGALNLNTDNFTGSRPWTSVDADLATGAQTHFLLVWVHRNPSRFFDNKLGGTAWIADVSLVPANPQTGQSSQ